MALTDIPLSRGFAVEHSSFASPAETRMHGTEKGGHPQALRMAHAMRKSTARPI
jgi:hypothetical protein